MAEAARVAGVSRQAIEDAINRGTLAHVTIKVPATRVRRCDVVAYARRTAGQLGRPKAT